MINPTYSVAAEVYIHAAHGRVWQKFCQLLDWPHWDSHILAAHWVDQSRQATIWQEGAHFQIQTQSRLGLRLETAIVRMVVPDDTLVWERATPGVTIVHSAHFADELGGCKLRVRHTYHGLAVFLFLLARGSQQKHLEETLHALKADIERR